MSTTWITVGTPLPSGPMRIAVTAAGVVTADYLPSDTAAPGPVCTDPAKIDAVTGRITEYLAGRRRDPALPIDWSRAGDAHRVVLRTLLTEVPYGRTITYGELAALSGVFEGVTEPGLASMFLSNTLKRTQKT